MNNNKKTCQFMKEHIVRMWFLSPSIIELPLSDVLHILKETVPFEEFDRIIGAFGYDIIDCLDVEQHNKVMKDENI